MGLFPEGRANEGRYISDNQRRKAYPFLAAMLSRTVLLNSLVLCV